MSGLGPLLRQLRLSAGLTQDELGERAGISVRTISDLERGVRDTAFRDTAARLADALGLEDAARNRLLTASRGETQAAPLLPRPSTRLVGRSDELSAIRQLVQDGARCVTLAGPGGVGKTRLALEIAGSVGAAIFVQLGDTPDAQLVPHLIARALGINPNRSAVLDVLIARLGSADLLLVLDTFEHVLDAAPTVAALLAACPGVTVLATSRSPLRVQAETVFVVPPLDIRAASELFAERALAARPDARLDDAVIADVCERFDRLPLAVELAAARIRHLPLSALRDRAGLAVLADGPRDAPERQRTMRDTIAWSYQLLDPRSQSLLRRLSPFATFALESAEAVHPDGDVLSGLADLIDRSLVEALPDTGEVPRYRLLDVIREFAADEAAAHDELALAKDAHAAYFVALAGQAEPELRTAAQNRWHRRIDEDLANLRLAEQHLIGTGDAESAVRLAASLFMFWVWHGGFAEGRRWLARALALDTDTQASQHGRALWAAGGLAFFVGDYAETGRIGAQLDAYGRGVDSDLDVRNGLTLRGLTALAEGEYTVAVDIFGEALEICPETAEWERATSLFNLAIALLHKGNVERADDLLAQAHDRYAAVGDEIYRARAIRNRAFAALARGDIDAASEFVELSLAVTTRVGDSWGIAESLEAVAVHRAARGDAYGCAAALARAGRLRDRIGASPYPFDSAFAERFIASVRNAGGWDEGWADDQPVTDG